MLKNHRNYPSEDITRIFIGHLNKTERIKPCCRRILKAIETELKISPFTDSSFHWEHIKLALSHPLLRNTALKAATKIYKNRDSQNLNLPPELLDVIENILTEGTFPKWPKPAYKTLFVEKLDKFQDIAYNLLETNELKSM